MADPARTDFSVDLVRTEPGICVVTVSGALDISTEGRVRAFLAAAIATPGTALVVVDVDRVTFVGVSGLRAVLDARAKAAERGIAVELVGDQPIVRRLLDVVAAHGTGPGQLPLHPDICSARRRLASSL
ncbi:anti-anti-sigma factor [Pseudonocardia thermophila]|jgi:Anti-anti-sigma regulatory factor (antagonist of anti-sigma factor)|uniref:Anti-anti-sigma factor n=1 Tax=Pseudonocardia thermophila TaxID=1848 RepID=A0A1M6TGF0_PSETH|nr:STAS domain-containing protein [Pseudonocardia thermophila]SHK55984.1 anti-anti-sigma factor [Pseudonocardia thermophila]